MLQLIYITNNVSEAKIVDRLDIDWIFIDLEVIGKKGRQIGRNTVLSNHSIADISKIRKNINNTNILVRCNPIGEWSRKEFDDINAKASEIDMVMLPYFKNIKEVEIFTELLDTSNIEAALLIETLGAINCLEQILQLYPFKYLHIGLNDLHIERNTVSMFEPYIDGLICNIVSIISKQDQTFGIGGIGKIGADLPPPSPECLINEHLRLNSNGVILSRSFKGNFRENSKDLFEKELYKSVSELRNYEQEALKLNSNQLLVSFERMKLDIEANIVNAKLQ